MARTQTRKETVTECGAPSSKLKALQEIIEERNSLLPIHKASSSSIQSSCIKPHLQTPKAPLLTSKSLLEECAPLSKQKLLNRKGRAKPPWMNSPCKLQAQRVPLKPSRVLAQTLMKCKPSPPQDGAPFFSSSQVSSEE
jgi:hypothetical protein